MPYKNIPVQPEVHTKVKNIADANYRGLGDQVAYWADANCQHPAKSREPMEVTFSKPENMAETHLVRGFYCKACRQFVIAPASAA